MNKNLKLFLAFVYIFTALVFIFLALNFYEEISLLNFMLFASLIIITHNASFFLMVSSKTYTTIQLPFILPGIVILGPFWMALIAFLFAFSFKKLKDFIWYKYLFNSCNTFLSVSIAGLIFNTLSNILNINILPFTFLAASFGYFIVNNSLIYIVLKFSGKGQPENFSTYLSHLIKNVLFSYILAPVFYQGYQAFGGVFLLLSLVVVYIAKDLFYSRLQQMNLSTQVVESFLKVIDAKDNYTQGHCERVAEYTAKLCRASGLSNKKTETIVNMAKIHDIGKIYINEETLKSTDSLTDGQYREMQKHSQYGYDLLQDIDLFKEDLDIIKHHHERYDGLGYPAGRKGEEIPEGARILSICDAFDVMTAGREYKPPMSKRQVIEEMKDCAGKQFDPEYTREMIKLIKDNHFDNRFTTSEPSQQEIESTRSRQIPLQHSV